MHICACLYMPLFRSSRRLWDPRWRRATANNPAGNRRGLTIHVRRSIFEPLCLAAFHTRTIERKRAAFSPRRFACRAADRTGMSGGSLARRKRNPTKCLRRFFTLETRFVLAASMGRQTIQFFPSCAALFGARRVAIAVLAVKAKPPSAVASKANARAFAGFASLDRCARRWRLATKSFWWGVGGVGGR